MFVRHKGLLWLYFFQSVLVLGPPCFVDSQPKGQALFLCVFEGVVYVYVISIVLLAFTCPAGSIIYSTGIICAAHFASGGILAS